MRLRSAFAAASFVVSACVGGDDGSEPTPDPTPAPPSFCETLGLPERAFDSTAPKGYHRRELADDFEIELIDEDDFVLSERWTGCDSYVFLPDNMPTSDIDDTMTWSREDDVAEMLLRSPLNVHWFFYSESNSDDINEDTMELIREAVDEALESIAENDDIEDGDVLAAHWAERIHYFQEPIDDVDNWLDTVSDGPGPNGFGIDPMQRVRGLGNFNDVFRYSAALANQTGWGWSDNIAYAAHEPASWNAESLRQIRLDDTDATIIPLWTGETIQQFADMEVMLPPAQEMAGFNRFEIEVDMRCPDPERVEAGNCGAWDYLAYAFVQEEDGEGWIQLTRAITTYHREAHWTMDASAMLPHLRNGGLRTFRWSWAPEWNVQPTSTRVNLRFWSDPEALDPFAIVPLWTGGGLNADYNAAHGPIDVAVPADAQRVELFAIITGHGMEAPNNCAEFCDHHHAFTVGADTHVKTHDAIGQDNGCVQELDNGMTPNQWGTWWFGRGGWCPGQQVDPFVVDVTAQAPSGQTTTFSYEASFNGQPPSGNLGNIDMISQVVFYR